MTWIVYAAGAWLLLSLLTGLLVGGAVSMEERASTGTGCEPAEGRLRPDAGTVPAPRTSPRVPSH
jgi:hypothetical protein